MKKGMLFGLSHREKRVKKINLLHFPVFTSKIAGTVHRFRCHFKSDFRAYTADAFVIFLKL